MTTILIADDSATIRSVVCQTLVAAGFDVLQAADGVDALNIARSNPVDLVITDVNMPNMGGMELLKCIRETESCGSVPVVMLTTEKSAKRKMQAKALGATGWILKPFSRAQFVESVNGVLARAA